MMNNLIIYIKNNYLNFTFLLLKHIFNFILKNKKKKITLNIHLCETYIN